MLRTIEEQAELACFELWNSGRIKSQRIEGMLIQDTDDVDEDGPWQWRWVADDIWVPSYKVVYSDPITTQCLLLLYREALGKYASCVKVPGGYRMYEVMTLHPNGRIYDSELECIVMNLARLAKETE